jgi:cyclin-dependent kinase 12/13
MNMASERGAGSIATFSIFDQIGEGTYGYVYKAKNKRDGSVVALKKLIIRKEGLGFPQFAVREIKFLRSLEHKNIVKLVDVITSKGCNDLDVGEESAASTSSRKPTPYGNMYLVFEYIEHDLGGLIDARYKFSLVAMKYVIKQLFAALDYLHGMKVIHRDIKPSNLLMTNRHQLKLADFGLARSAVGVDGQEGRVDLTNNVVTIWYKCPELLLGSRRYTAAIDLWSAGCVLAELALGRPIFPGKTEVEQIDLVFSVIGTPCAVDEGSARTWVGYQSLPHFNLLLGDASTIYDEGIEDSWIAENNGQNTVCDQTLKMLKRVLVADPLKRISAQAALEHSYFFADPIPPQDAFTLPPVNLPGKHEYQTKQKNKEANARMLEKKMETR